MTISGFTGRLAGVEVFVEIDHPDPQQLRLTLTGPDGTTVILHDQTGQHEHPINAIYGKTSTFRAVARRLPGPAAQRRLDPDGRRQGQDTPTRGRIRTFAIEIAGQPARFDPAVPRDRAPGHGARPGLEVLLQRPARPQPRNDAADASSSTSSPRPGRAAGVKATDDRPRARCWRSTTSSPPIRLRRHYGPIVASAPNTGFLISGRPYTNTADGSFGHSVPGSRPSDGLAWRRHGDRQRPGQEREFHSNVGFTEVSGAPVQVRVDVRRRRRHAPGSTSTAAANRRSPVSDVIGPRPRAHVQLPRDTPSRARPAGSSPSRPTWTT